MTMFTLQNRRLAPLTLEPNVLARTVALPGPPYTDAFVEERPSVAATIVPLLIPAAAFLARTRRKIGSPSPSARTKGVGMAHVGLVVTDNRFLIAPRGRACG
jgi:hypothetical protein